jgi:hypothetical protein
MILQNTDNYLPGDTVAFPRITKSAGFKKVFSVLGRYTIFVGSCLPVFQDSLLVPSSRDKQSILLGLPDP